MGESVERSSTDLRAILDAIPDGVTVQDRSGRLVYANQAAARAIGYASADALLAAPLNEVMAEFELMDERGDPLPVERLPGRQVLAGQEPPEVIVRFRSRTGQDQWSMVQARPIVDDAGVVSLAVNVFRDVTNRHQVDAQVRAGARQQAAVAHLGQRALDVTDVGELIEDAVRLVAETIGVDLVAFRELTGEQDKVVIRTGLGWRESIGRTEAAGPGTQHGFALALEDPVEVEDLASEARFRPSSLLVERGAASGIAARVAGRNHPAGILEAFATEPRTFDRDDVHFMQAVANILGTALERDRAERDRAELLERERQSRAEAEGMQWGLAFLAVASNVLAGSLSVETTLSNVARLAVPSFADWCVVHLLQDDGSLAEVALAHSDPERVEWVRKLQERYPPDPDAQTGILAVAGTGRSEIYPEIPDELLAKAARDEEHLALLKDLGLRSAMIVPLISRGRTLGTITFVAAESGRRYGEIDLTMAEDLARRAGLAVDNARLYEASTRVARTLQRSLLPPELPRIPRIDLAARFRPAGRGDEVGGDFYDLFETANRNWAVVIGDVCGKGADAAAMTALARYTIRAAAIRDSRPSRVLSALNEGLLRQVSDQRFCTACYVRVRLASGSARLTVASGGHPLPIVVHPDGRTERVGRPGSLLGVFEDPEVFDHAVDLEAGDTMLLYTDGVIEQHDGDELFGEERLHSILSASSGERAEAIADRIERAVLSFQPNLPRDDMAVLVLQVAPS